MGAVYRARHVRTGRRYAVKVMPQASALDPDLVRRFRREAELLASLGHAGLVAVHDFDVADDGTAYMVMDCLAGEDVAARIERQGALEPEQALKVARQVASALEAAHAAGVLHRDLKPANIFLQSQPGAEERAVLLDFGIAKIMEHGDATRLTQTGATIGTPGYMSPEQARAEELDVRSDVYSLGCVVYEMLCGIPPFDGPTVTAILAKVLTEDAPRPSSIEFRLPAALDDVMAKALSKKREDRYLTPTALVRDLEHVFAGYEPMSAGALAPTDISPANPSQIPASSPKPRHLLEFGLALLLLGFLLVGGVSWWWLTRSSETTVVAAPQALADEPQVEAPAKFVSSSNEPVVSVAGQDAGFEKPDADVGPNSERDLNKRGIAGSRAKTRGKPPRQAPPTIDPPSVVSNGNSPHPSMADISRP